MFIMVLFSFSGETLKSVRSGKWKLHVAPPGRLKEKVWKPDEKWTDPRAPDGVRIIAPYEQAHPSQYPGVMTGDVPYIDLSSLLGGGQFGPGESVTTPLWFRNPSGIQFA